MPIDKFVRGYQERTGYVEEVHPDHYIVFLDTAKGPMAYNFPSRFYISKEPLKPRDHVRCCIVKAGKALEPRLTKMPKPVVDKKSIDSKFEEFRQRAINTRFAEYQAKQRLRE